MASRSPQLGRPEGRQGLATYYRSLLAEQQSSGLSVAEFAEEQGLSAATLYSWRRRLACDGRSSSTPATPLLEVKVAGSSPRRARSLVLRVGELYEIELGEDFDGDALGRLLDLLEC